MPPSGTTWTRASSILPPRPAFKKPSRRNRALGLSRLGSEHEAVIGDDEHGCLVLHPGGGDRVEHATDARIGIRNGRIAARRLRTEHVMRAVDVQQMQEHQVRLSFSEHQSGCFRPDVVALRSAGVLNEVLRRPPSTSRRPAILRRKRGVVYSTFSGTSGKLSSTVFELRVQGQLIPAVVIPA